MKAINLSAKKNLWGSWHLDVLYHWPSSNSSPSRKESHGLNVCIHYDCINLNDIVAGLTPFEYIVTADDDQGVRSRISFARSIKTMSTDTALRTDLEHNWKRYQSVKVWWLPSQRAAKNISHSLRDRIVKGLVDVTFILWCVLRVCCLRIVVPYVILRIPPSGDWRLNVLHWWVRWKRWIWIIVLQVVHMVPLLA